MKDNFEILNNVEIDLDKYEDLNIDKDKLKNKMRAQIKAKSKFKKNIAVAASACIVCGGIIGAGIINPSLASNIPVIENIFEDLNETLGIDKIYTQYVQGIGQTQTINGVTVSVDEAISDGHNLYLTYKIKSKEKLARHDDAKYIGENLGNFMLYKDIKIDNDGSLVSGISLDGYYKDDYTFVGMESYQIDFKGKEAPSNFNVKIKINEIGGVNSNIEDMIKGPFKFSLNIDSKVDLEVIDVNKIQEGCKVRNVEVSPYSINVNIEFPKEYIDDNLKEVSLYDDKGNLVASQGYDEDGIKFNKTRVENNTVYDTILFNYIEVGYESKPDYVILKFEDFYQSQEPVKDSSLGEKILLEPQKIKDTKDIEFKIDLTKTSN